MRVYIITESNSKVGFGHLSRCLSLYYAFIERNIIPSLIINKDDDIIESLNNIDHIKLNWLKETEKLYAIVKEADVAIIDSYNYQYNILNEICNIVKLPIFIDDNNRMNYPRGIVINGAIHAKDMDYTLYPQLFYLLGTKFCMLKKEFWDILPKETNKNIENIMITFGANDIRNVTPKILKLLNKNFPSIKKKIIIGKYYQNISQIEEFKNDSCELLYFPSTNSIKEVMLNSDIAITAGGQTSYELASMGIPAIIIIIAENQIKSSEKLNELGMAFNAGWWQNRDLSDKIIYFVQKLKKKGIREKIVKINKKNIKPDGSRNIIDVIIKKINNITL